MNKLTFFVALFFCVGIWGCEDNKEDGSITKTIKETKINAADVLNKIISANNDFLNKQDNTKIFTINNQSDFNKISNEIINFDNITIVVGVVVTPSISDNINDIVLYQRNKTFNLEIIISKASNGWTAIGKHYFWKAYPKINTKDIELTIKEK